jgi:hypothetical protein
MLVSSGTTTAPTLRLEQLVRAFQLLKAGRTDLEVGVRGTTTNRGVIVDIEHGVDLRLRCARTASAAVLRVSRTTATLRAVSAVRPSAAAVSVLEDQLSLHLEEGYVWGGSRFVTATALADALLSYMQLRLAAVAEACVPFVPRRRQQPPVAARPEAPTRVSELMRP